MSVVKIPFYQIRLKKSMETTGFGQNNLEVAEF